VDRRSQRYAQTLKMRYSDYLHDNDMFSAIFLSIAVMVVFLSSLIAYFKPNTQNYFAEGIDKPLVLPSCNFCNASVGGNDFNIVYEVRMLASI